MTVYSRKSADGVSWRYDFQQAGARYTSPEPFPTKRAAQAAENARRREVREGGALLPFGSKRRRGVTLAQACDLFWRDVAQHHRSARDIKRRLDIVRRLIGADMLIAEIKFAVVNEAIRKRRAEPGRNGQALSAGTVNLDIVDTLRPVLNHAAAEHELALPRIAWGKLRLKGGAPIVREFDAGERERWAKELGDDAERAFLHLALRYGPRLGELFFPPSAFKRDARGRAVLELGRHLSKDGVWRDSRKDGSMHTLPLLDDDAALVADLVDRANGYGAPHVWISRVGALISYYAMRGRLHRAAIRAGIEPGRIIHGMRHHAGTQMARQGLGLARELLGHRQIETTMRYAHTNSDDMRAGLNKVAVR